MNYRENVMLKDYTTLKIGGPAKRFYEPKTILEISQIVKEHTQNNIPLVILGNGSNMLFEDEGYDGSILHIGNALNQIEFLDDTTIRVYAGVENGELALWLAGHELGGYEFASGIPGTVGGAVIMNAGAYNGEMVDVLAGVGYVDENGLLQYATADKLDLSYRHSWFTDHFGVVVYADLKLHPTTLKEAGEKLLDLYLKRHSKQPMEKASAGSTFKRPVNGYASALIHECGLQGVSVGDAMVSTKHAGFLINDGDASCKEFLELVEKVQKTVKEQRGVDLELEVRYIRKNPVNE